jgi:hypothetical protein
VSEVWVIANSGAPDRVNPTKAENKRLVDIFLASYLPPIPIFPPRGLASALIVKVVRYQSSSSSNVPSLDPLTMTSTIIVDVLCA